jgi:hypothetical protein
LKRKKENKDMDENEAVEGNEKELASEVFNFLFEISSENTC